MRKNFSPLLLIGLFLILSIAAIACGSGDDSTATPVATGTLAGKVIIGPLCPVEPCNSQTNPYPDHEVLVTDSSENIVSRIAVNIDGTFVGTVPVGDYSVRLEPCEYLGCNFGVPMQVVITEGTTTNVEIDIDTGIR